MKVKCNYCTHHRRTGAKHTCEKCTTRSAFGEIQVLFIDNCHFFEMTETERERRKMLQDAERPSERETMKMKKWEVKKWVK